jgi:maleamate amidohydrolase
LPFGTRPALLLVDMVMAYLTPSSPLCAGDAAASALGSAARLADAARAAGAPVVLTNVLYSDGAEGGLFFRKVPALTSFLEGNPDGDFPPELAPRPGDIVVTKHYPSAFFGTSLAPMLHALGVDSLLIAGYSTSGCVRASGLDALCHGFAPFVVRDACADRRPEPHEANLFDLQAKYAEVISEADALARLAALTPR